MPINAPGDYYDGQTPQRQPVTLFVSRRGLHLQFYDRSIHTWAFQDFKYVHTGVAGEALRFEKGLETVESEDHRILDALQKYAPKTFRHRRPVFRPNNLLRTVGIILLSGVVMIWLFYRIVLPALGRELATFVPVRWESAIGEAMVAKVVPPRLRASENAGTAAIEAVMARLIPALDSGKGYRYRVTLSKSPVVNAYALPGGRLIVNQGLLAKLNSPEELAGVLAHEIQHVERRHAVVRLCEEATMGIVILLVSGGSDGVASIVRTTHGLGSLAMSRAAENEADKAGFELLVAAQIDPQAMVRAYSHLKDPTPGHLEFLSTHPDTSQRIAQLRKRARTIRMTPRPITLTTPWHEVRQVVLPDASH